MFNCEIITPLLVVFNENFAIYCEERRGGMFCFENWSRNLNFTFYDPRTPGVTVLRFLSTYISRNLDAAEQ